MKLTKDSSRYLFVFSCTLSVLFHGCLFYFLYLNPPLIRVVATKLFPSSYEHPIVGAKNKELEEYKEKNETLDEVISQTYFVRHYSQSAKDAEEGIKATFEPAEISSDNLLKELSSNEDSSPLAFLISPSSLDWNEGLAEDEKQTEENKSEAEGLATVVSILSQDRPFSYEIALSESPILTDEEQGDARILNHEEEGESKLRYALFPQGNELGVGTDFTNSHKMLAQRAFSETRALLKDFELREKSELKTESVFHNTTIKAIESYGLPDVFVKKWDQQFDSQLSSFIDEEGALYFSIDLKATPSFKQTTLPSSYLFVIDAVSNGAKKGYQDHVLALTKSLKQLNKGDLFNIAIIGKNTKMLSKSYLSFSMKALLEAEEFLNSKVEFSGRCKDLLEGLNKTIANFLSNDKELCNVFLLTNGEDRNLSKEEKASLQKVIKSSRGKVAIFPVHLQEKAQPLLFEALSITTGGKILAYPTAASYARKLSGLVVDVKTAILKDLFLDAIADNADTEITLAPVTDNFLRLYERKPLKIIGRMSKPSAFTLRIRGLNGEELVTIEKRISLSFSRKGNASLKESFETAERSKKFNDFALGRCDIPDKISLKTSNKERKR